jgi:putative selenium metabolism hydrolase
MVQTPSLPGQEGEVAELVKSEMKRLGFDKVVRDEAGNVLGFCKGEGIAPAMMFNTHLDHVDVGDPAAWPYPPYGAELHDKKVWGRGTVDIKGPMAAQIHAVGSMIGDGARPPGDVYVTTVVQEETGGLGARHLLTHLKPPLVVVGEPSRCQLKRGHRGRTELILHVKGRSVHASVPDQASNPLEVLARFVLGLKELEMLEDVSLGSSSVAPTLLKTDQTSPNVTPGEVWLTCDCRTVPGESGLEMIEKLQALADRCLDSGCLAEIRPCIAKQSSYTGVERKIPAQHPAFLVPSEHRAVVTAASILKRVIALNEDPGIWSFATDGGFFAAAGQTVIGFGPGNDKLAHTVEESIEITELEKALHGNKALAMEWPVANRD